MIATCRLSRVRNDKSIAQKHSNRLRGRNSSSARVEDSGRHPVHSGDSIYSLACAGVVFLTDVGEVDVADLVLVVEGDEQSPVPDRDVTGHVRVSLPIKPAFAGAARADGPS